MGYGSIVPKRDRPRTAPSAPSRQRTQAVYYRAADGSEPVAASLRSLKGRREPNLRNQIERLNMLGPNEHLPIEYSKQVEGELRELRCHYGSELYRVYYRRSGNLFVLLHIIRKLGERLPEADTAIARERWRDFKARMDARPRIPPRAAGHDAP